MLLVVLAVVAVAFVVHSGAGKTRKAALPPPRIAAPPTTTIPPAVLPADPAALPQSSTYTTIDGAPLDPGPPVPTDRIVVHPRR